jgi:uncharacterized GH25 family protein
MRKLSIALALCIALIASSAWAHTMWVYGEPPQAGKNASIIRGYGDMFPINKTIDEKRLAYLPAPELMGPDGKKIALTPSKDNNYTFVTGAPLSKGTYLVLGEYSPTYWTRTYEFGWFIAPKDKSPGTAAEAYLTVSFCKGVYNVDGALDTDLITKPIGTEIEIVPLSNPQASKVNDTIKFQVIFRDKPLPGALVTGMAEGYGDDHEFKAWAFLTDDEGIVEFIPWKAGGWQLEVRHGVPPSEPGKALIEWWNAKIAFFIN